MHDIGAYRPYTLPSPRLWRALLWRLIVVDAEICTAVLDHYAERRLARLAQMRDAA